MSRWTQISLGSFENDCGIECGWIYAQIGLLVYKRETDEFIQGTNLLENIIYQMYYMAWFPLGTGLLAKAQLIKKGQNNFLRTGYFQIPNVVKTCVCNNLNDMQYEQSQP